MINSYALKGGLRTEMMSIATASPDAIRDVWYDAILITPKRSIPINLLESVRIIRDFNAHTTDIIKIVFNMHAGDYIKDVKPYKDSIHMRLSHTLPGPQAVDDYKLVIALEDKHIASDVVKGSKEELNNAIVTIHGECIDESVLFLKSLSKGVIINNGTVEAAIANVLDYGISKVTGKFGIGKRPVSIMPVDNTRVYEHIVIPATTKVLNAPILLQENLGGVYNGSINTYVYRYGNILRTYVFPLYRTNLLKSTTKKLIIVSVTALEAGAGESTYSVDSNGDVRVLVMQKDKLDDDGVEMLSKGGGVVGIDANTVKGRPITVSDDGVSIKSKSMYRKMKEKVSDDLSDILYVPPTDNFYEPRSVVLKNKLAKVTVEWNFSNASLLYPYMPVIFLEEDHGKSVMREGVLNGLDIFTINSAKKETTVLSLLITKRESTAIKPVKLF